MRLATGEKLLTWRDKAAIRRAGQVLPKWGEKRVVIARWGVWYTAHWLHGEGYRITGWRPAGAPVGQLTRAGEHPLKERRVKRRTPAEVGLPPIPLPSDSKLFHKLPLLREFLSATAYDDQSIRTPGYFTMRNRGGSYEVTVYDPDAGLRCAVRAATIDDAFAGVELLLGAENAPWEVDSYLSDQLAKKRKKRA